MATEQSPERARPWQRHAADVPVDEGIVGRWIHDLEDAQTEAAQAQDPARQEDGVSVVVTFELGDDVAPCLRSIAAQTIDHDRFEVVAVVPHGTDLAPFDTFEAERRDVRLRLIELPATGRFAPRDVGTAAARRTYTAFLAAADYLSSSYLETMLDRTTTREIVAAHLVDAATDAPVEHPLTYVAGKLVPTTFAKQVSTSDEIVFLLTLLARYRLDVARTDQQATYFRAPRVTLRQGRTQDFDLNVAAPMHTIGKLSELEGTCPRESLELLRDHIRLVAAPINAYLKEKPEDHDRVLDLIESYDLAEFPYDVVNRGLARSLAISYCFVPYNDTSAIVMAKRVRARRDLVDVVFNTMDQTREIDPSMRRISSPFVEDEIPIATPTRWSSWPRIDEFRLEGMRRIEALEAQKGPYAKLYSRVMWPASQFLAASYKLHNPSVTWVAEFSDPVSRDVTGAERGTPIEDGPFLDAVHDELKKRGLPVLDSDNLMAWCEYLAYTLADRIVFTNENQLEYMLSYCPVPELVPLVRAKTVVSPHPSLPPRFYSMSEQTYPLDPSAAHLAYFGNFYATRGLGDLLNALAGLDEPTKSRLHLHVFTGNADDLRTHVKSLGIEDNVHINPYVRFLAFLNLTTKFDCLIVNDALTADSHAKNPYLPSKWSDYKGSGRPVWGLIEDGSPLSKQPLTYSSPVGDLQAAQEILRKLAQSKMS
ncbi:glycosyltransferase [Tenggerimyces flavus]|uniref:Glycosyltransferase n=1 Tax=Tenggerimyces flavus TaxID=1708749 RepID=A0ABV7Y7D6_9ACTN|nr:glycosyltransferase [Tenggerimyces flavus]MBM7790571.1 hypothetical protein [Tenggerimyces flavus]